jgi:hypothetical protein
MCGEFIENLRSSDHGRISVEPSFLAVILKAHRVLEDEAVLSVAGLV